MASLIRKINRGSPGFTLVEVMVAITLLMLVVLPLASLYVKSLTTIQNAAIYSQALALVHSRMEIVEDLDYQALDYTNPIFCPGFSFETLPSNAYELRDNPDTPDVTETYFDPTDNGGTANYPVPVYRDYYNNFTGQLIDPNYNGLCDDDLNGDGVVDVVDIAIGNPNNDTFTSGPYSGLPKAGDGVYDTVVEGMYVNTYDPTMWHVLNVNEAAAPIIDYSLQLDRNQSIDAVGADGLVRDYRHREKTFRNFVRMTTIIDPTPRLADPNHPDAIDDWMDQYYFWERHTTDSYTDKQLLTLSLCLERDLPLIKGTNSLSVAVGGENAFVVANDSGTGLEETDPFKVNYSVPLFGKKVIVTVFYLSGKGEVIYEDLDGDGIPEELPSESYANAKHVSLERLFVNDVLLFKQESLRRRDPSYTVSGLVWDLSNPLNPVSWVRNILMVPPQRRFLIDNTISTPDGIMTIPDISTGDEYDPCAEGNDGLPYLGDRYWFPSPP